jgi:hypothetical protein
MLIFANTSSRTERAFMIASFLAVFGIAWQALDRSPPYDLVERAVLNPIVSAGGYLRTRYRVKVQHTAEITFRLRLYDGAGIAHDYLPRVLQTETMERGPEAYVGETLIPSRAEPGPSKLVATMCWERPYNIVHQLWPPCMTQQATDLTILPAAVWPPPPAPMPPP